MKHINKINRGRVNLALSTAAFTISSSGSVLLHIWLAVTVYENTGSGLMTSLFVALQWLPALLVVLYRSNWDTGMNPRVRWCMLELVSAAMTLPILFFIPAGNYTAVALILLFRGVVDQVNRINKTVASRVLFPKAKATHYAAFLQSSYHLGIALAAVTGILLAGSLDVRLLTIVDAVTFLVAAGLIGMTRCVEPFENAHTGARLSLASRIAQYRDVVTGDKRLLVCAVLPPLTATFFQGTYSALQPIFPIRGLGLGRAAVSASYVLVSIAVVAGSSAFAFICKKYRPFEQPFIRTKTLAGVLSVLAAVFYVGAVLTTDALLSAVLFALMVGLFEFVWMIGYGGIVAFAPPSQLGSVFGISFAIGCLAASVLAALVGWLVDVFGGTYALLVGLLMIVYLSVLAAVLLAGKRSGEVIEVAGQAVESV